MGVPNADPVGRRGTGRAGVAPKCVPAATEGVHTGPCVDRGGVAASRPRPYSLTGPVTAPRLRFMPRLNARLPPPPPPS
eukprot:57636-Chlamydomonas_euryale.AAC.1